MHQVVLTLARSSTFYYKGSKYCSKPAKENEGIIDPALGAEAIVGMILGGVSFFTFLFYVCFKNSMLFLVYSTFEKK